MTSKNTLSIPDIKSSVAQKLASICYQQQDVDKNILLQIKGNQANIIFNRPSRMNAFSIDMYFTFVEYLIWANENQDIKFIIVSGAGGNFSSGNDLMNFAQPQLNQLNPKLRAQGMADYLDRLGKGIINSKKPIFALVQGKCIGFAFTQLALYDKVFAVKDTYFMAPLVRTAQGPQMCSSYLFPKIFGQAVSQQIIIKAKSISAEQLEKYRFLQSCSSRQQADQLLQTHIKQLQQLDWNSYMEARRLMRQPNQQILLKTSTIQCNNLVQRWQNPNLVEYLMQYMRKKKSQKKVSPKL